MTTDFLGRGKPGKALTRLLSQGSRARRRALKAEVDLAAVGGQRRNDLTPTLSITLRSISALRPARRRVRKSDPVHVARLAKSIAAHTFTVPILISADGEIVDGHIRVEAAALLNLSEIPCITVDHLSPEQIRTLSIAVNRVQELGTWDLEELRLEFESLVEIDSLENTAFEAPEIELILSSGDSLFDERANSHPDYEQQATSRLGDVWLLGDHVVLCGDALDRRSYEILMMGSVARLLFTDPPFNCPIDGFVGGKGSIRHREFVSGAGELNEQEFELFLTTFLGAASAQLVDGGIGLVFMDWRQLEVLLRAGRKATLSLQNLIVWDKGRGGMGGTFRNAHELIAMFKRGGTTHLNNVELGKHGRDRSNIWAYPGATTLGSSARKQLESHPTPKSVELVFDALLDLTNRREIVLDPFLGSGTTVIAAEKSGRKCCGIELDPAYVDVIVRRWQSFTGRIAFHADKGTSFAEVGQERHASIQPVGALDQQSPTDEPPCPDDAAGGGKP